MVDIFCSWYVEDTRVCMLFYAIFLQKICGSYYFSPAAAATQFPFFYFPVQDTRLRESKFCLVSTYEKPLQYDVGVRDLLVTFKIHFSRYVLRIKFFLKKTSSAEMLWWYLKNRLSFFGCSRWTSGTGSCTMKFHTLEIFKHK